MKVSVPLYDDNIGRVELIDYMGDDKRIVNSARVSFGNDSDLPLNEKDEKLIQYLYKNEHLSTFEHCIVTWKFVVPLMIRSQHHRHRTFCLSGDTKLTFNRPCDGRPYYLSIKEVYDKWHSDPMGPERHLPSLRARVERMSLRSCDEDQHSLISTYITDIWESGVKDVYVLDFGRQGVLKASKDHLCLTDKGWLRLEDALEQKAGFCSLTRRVRNLNRPIKLSNAELKEEKWKFIDGFDEKYEISDLGRIRSYCNTRNRRLEKPVIKKQTLGRNGYWCVSLSENSISKVFLIHQLVAKTFIGSPLDGQECRHLNSNAMDNRLINLKYGSAYENTQDRILAGNTGVNEIGYIQPISIKLEKNVMTYDLSVEGPYHNFMAGGVFVHNSYNELSRRYTSENLQFFVPKTFRTQHKSNKQASNEDNIDPQIDWLMVNHPASLQMKRHVEQSLLLYEGMIDAGISKEEARMVLPQCLYTEYYGTVNLRNALHFIALRMHHHAQKEIRVVAEAMLHHLENIYPVAIKAFMSSQQLRKEFAEFEKNRIAE